MDFYCVSGNLVENDEDFGYFIREKSIRNLVELFQGQINADFYAFYSKFP